MLQIAGSKENKTPAKLSQVTPPMGHIATARRVGCYITICLWGTSWKLQKVYIKHKLLCKGK